ncbi:tetraacyldisaccharide 4'-kinase [Vibrio breoganii]|uniref:tetraacyldisaccharide 4'-kinase n=1 Tax=Vibrio breoganii TaxID=553239 RepID=UPI0003626094|nr:tetraacyldisaccharide 4'-kinase [Vibrio breoganii]OED83274.1 tetraacyldisaccharide 4'-kinase [Vibrio breoganii ZF-55]PMG79437.1 tetraacyldisaccharide 4'-kinase [Vibrio breoganii]PMM17562.1 tetraacyldisaccharide 4'-kinase [Vibrio breoganii]
MIHLLWFSSNPVRWLFWPLLWPLSQLFKVISQGRRRDYLQGKKPSYRAPVPIVVVGNITAGGNGKTPVVVWLVESLQAQGLTVGVVSRGYGAKAPSYPLLVGQDTPTTHCGDEPKLIAQRTGAIVVVDPVRSNAVKHLLQNDVDIVVTDDGLQHYALQRDIEFIVIDGKRRFGNEHLIPLGPLREKMSRLQTVDFRITNGGEAQSGEIGMTLQPSLAVNLVTGEKKSVDQLGALTAIAGIGHPPRFFDTLESMQANVITTKGFADHKALLKADIMPLIADGHQLIMTEKDAVKCRDFADENWWYLPVSAQISDNNRHKIMNRIQEVLKEYGS